MNSPTFMQARVSPNAFPPWRRIVKRRVTVRAEDLRKVLKRGSFEPDSAYVDGGDFLRKLGMTNQAEISRVLDIAMNPDSLFLSPKQRRMSNASARRLSVEDDMEPVLFYLKRLGLKDSQIIKMISSNPCILGYNVEQRLMPVFDYLQSIGVKDVASILSKRPSLFGLDVKNNLQKIVNYLENNNYPPEQIVEWLETSL